MFKTNKAKRWTSWFAALMMVLTLVTPFNVKAADAKVFDLIEITDFHGQLVDSSNTQIPIAAVLAKNINDIKNANPDRTLIMGGGDLYQGTPISNVLKGVPVQKVMDSIGMEITTLGNHEFDWTIDTLLNTTMKDAKYSIVSANVYDKATNKPAFEPYKIIAKDGLKIALVGGITMNASSSILAANIVNYEFKDLTTEVNAVVKDIRDNKKADVVVALLHEGSDANDKNNATGPIFTIANDLKGVDAVFAGHSHTAVTGKAANGTPIYIAKSNGKGFIDAKMTVAADGKVSFAVDPTSYIALDNDKPNGYKAAAPVQDSAVKAIVDEASKTIGPTFDEVIGKTATDLKRTQSVTPYGESYLGNWTTDVIRSKVNADVAIQNNGGLRTDIPAGDITVGQIYSYMPFDNEICWVNMTKAQLKVVLEQAVMDGGKGLQISGVKFTYDSARNSMDRVVNITREDGTAIADTETLKVATNDFQMTGGDGFAGFVTAGGASNGIALNNTHILVRDALMENVRANQGIVATMNGRLTNVGKTINVVATSDLHGTIYPYDYATGAVTDGSLARVSTYVNGLRTSNPNNVMLVDNGDTIQGSPLVTYYNLIDTKSEYPMMKIMGYMKYDTWELGNHEFNFGLESLNRIMNDAQKEGINVLGANIHKTSDNSSFVKPYVIKNFDVNGKTVKVGILGMITKTVPSWEDAPHYAGLKFNDLVEDAKVWVPKMKAEGADVVIATIHSGIKSASDTIPENQIDEVAKNVSGIDVIVAGHTHKAIPGQTFTNPDGKTVLVTQPINTDKTISQIDINVTADGKVGLVTTKNVTIDKTIAVDTNITETLAKTYQDKTLEYINTVIGKATAEFSGKDQTLKPTALMDLINKVQMEAAGTQLSIAAPLSASAYIPAGDVKIKDLMSVYVFENFLYGVKMTGAQLKDWMEWSVKYYKQVQNPNDPAAKDTILNTPDYNLDFLYGATYDVDLTQPACTYDKATGKVISGNRIKNLMVNGKPVKPTDVFTVAINNYRFNGGGGFMAAAGLKPGDQSIVVYDSAKKLGDDGQVRNLMIKYTQDNKTLTPTVANNWVLSTTPVADKTGSVLPKTGSMVDMNLMISFGALVMMLGVAMFIAQRRKENENAA